MNFAEWLLCDLQEGAGKIGDVVAALFVSSDLWHSVLLGRRTPHYLYQGQFQIRGSAN